MGRYGETALEALAERAAAFAPTALKFNYCGEVRTVTAHSVVYDWDGKQWLMRGYDEEMRAVCDFSARDVSFI